MPFLFFSSTDIQFDTEELTWRSYTIAKALPITKKVELIDKHKFAKTALDENLETFVIYVATQETSEMIIYPSQTAWIATLQ